MYSKQTNTHQSQGLIRGKAPHRHGNAHAIHHFGPYFRTSILWLISLILLFSALGMIGYGIHLGEKSWILKGIISMSLWVFARFLVFLSGKSAKCPLCRGSHLSGGRSSKHQHAFKFFPLRFSTTAILTSSFFFCIRCMHCGVCFNLLKRNR